jgi:hypothetical protein
MGANPGKYGRIHRAPRFFTGERPGSCVRVNSSHDEKSFQCLFERRDEGGGITSIVVANRSNLVVQSLTQSHSLVGHRKAQGLPIAIEARVCHQLQFFNQSQNP